MLIAFGGRTLRSDKTLPKYINTAESEAYEKSKVLYGISFAKHSIRKEDTCFLCEGYTDVISLHQAGVENTVSSSGTALTPDQIKLIKRFTDNVTILYDGDEAVTNIQTVKFDSSSSSIDDRKKWVSLVLIDRQFNKKVPCRLLLLDAETEIMQQSVEVNIERAFNDDF